MATLVCFHAHPDDEAIATGGVMLRAARAGHRVVLVVATRGEAGEVPDGFLDPGETLAERRVKETIEAARILGVARGAWLDYRDSGMMGTATNEDPGCFWQADVEEAAGRLADILAEESCDVLTIYDENGGYGHPDHIQVHRVGVRAAEIAGVERVYESTINRDHMKRLWAQMGDRAPASAEPGSETGPPDLDQLGVSEELINTAVDVRDLAELKRAAMRAHASQIAENSFFLQMPDDAFREVFGVEWFIRRGVPGGGPLGTDLFDGLG